jgi:plastocyanin
MKMFVQRGYLRTGLLTGLTAMCLLLLVAGAACQGQAASPSVTSKTPAGTGPGTSAKADVNIVGLAFEPATLTINAGNTVVWHNNASVAHTITSRDKLFDSGTVAPRATFAFTFATAGTYEYFCGLHPGMVGKVIVQ